MATDYQLNLLDSAVDSSSTKTTKISNCQFSEWISNLFSWNVDNIYNSGFADKYCLKHKEVIGTGAYSTVKKGIEKEKGTKCAVKIIKKSILKPKDITHVNGEMEILRSLNHKHIVQLHGFYEDRYCFYLVTEYIPGGELWKRVTDKKKYSEKEACDVGRILVDTLVYIHSKKIAHRDLKPENLLLVHKTGTHKTCNTNIKIIDFGYAKQITGPTSLTTKCGSPFYVAPEVLVSQPYTTQVDLWSVGVIMYFLLAGSVPFYGEDNTRIFRKVRRGKFSFPNSSWYNVSDNAKNIISELLVLNPQKRLTAKQASHHKWFDEDLICSVPNFEEKIRKSHLKRYLGVSNSFLTQ